MGGDHGHAKIKVPDWKTYRVEDTPELMRVQTALAQKGLKDPWLRNEVWRYNTKEFSCHGERIRRFLFRGFKYGFAAFVVTICTEKLLFSGHGHGHDKHDH